MQTPTPPTLNSKVTLDVTEKIAKEDYKSSDDSSSSSSSKVDEEKTKSTEKRVSNVGYHVARTTLTSLNIR